MDGELQQEQQQRQERNAIKSPFRRMVKFIKQCGDVVRFDVFAREHLVGSGGFYSDQIDLSKEHSPVATPMEMESQYRAAYARKVLHAIATVAKRTGKSEICVAEIGPGGGELHREIIDQFNAAKESFEGVESLRYIAIDPNSKHLQNIKAQGGIGIKGVAQSLPLANESIDVLIAEEVLDSLPYRIFQIGAGGSLGKEAFVRLNGNQMELVFRPLEASEDERAILAKVARLSHQENPGSKIFRYSDDYVTFWQECYRVVTENGIALISDYTTGGIMPMMGENDLGHEEAALRAPYQRDLTHMVNFTLQMAFASFPGFKADRQSLNSADLRVMLAELVGVREVIVADKSKDTFSPVDLQRFYDGTHGVRNVISTLIQRGPEDGKKTVDFLTRNNLNGGALWTIYADLADRDMERFMGIIKACTPKQMEWIKDNQ